MNSSLIKKAIVFDLDGTLAESKSAISTEMSTVLCGLLNRYFLAVVSGGTYSQFRKQFLGNFSCNPDLLENLFLFPTNGSVCYKYNSSKKDWEMIYNEEIEKEDRQKIIEAFKEVIEETNVDLNHSYGEIIEDRGSQVTFSGCGQEAPIAIKEVWDKDQFKRQKMVSLLKEKIPQFEIRIGGMTSIDVTRSGIDKAYAVEKIKNLINITDEDIIFVGDALYKGGNDSSIKKTGVDFIQKDGPGETLEFLRQFA